VADVLFAEIGRLARRQSGDAPLAEIGGDLLDDDGGIDPAPRQRPDRVVVKCAADRILERGFALPARPAVPRGASGSRNNQG